MLEKILPRLKPVLLILISFPGQRINSSGDFLVHLDERRPGTFETFARQFLRRGDAESAADGDFVRRATEHVHTRL